MSGHKIPQGSPIIGEETYTAHKNRRKKVRAVVQLLVLLVVVFAILQMFFTLKTYEPYAAAEPSLISVWTVSVTAGRASDRSSCAPIWNISVHRGM